MLTPLKTVHSSTSVAKVSAQFMLVTCCANIAAHAVTAGLSIGVPKVGHWVTFPKVAEFVPVDHVLHAYQQGANAW